MFDFRDSDEPEAMRLNAPAPVSELESHSARIDETLGSWYRGPAAMLLQGDMAMDIDENDAALRTMAVFSAGDLVAEDTRAGDVQADVMRYRDMTEFEVILELKAVVAQREEKTASRPDQMQEETPTIDAGMVFDFGAGLDVVGVSGTNQNAPDATSPADMVAVTANTSNAIAPRGLQPRPFYTFGVLPPGVLPATPSDIEDMIQASGVNWDAMKEPKKTTGRRARPEEHEEVVVSTGISFRAVEVGVVTKRQRADEAGLATARATAVAVEAPMFVPMENAVRATTDEARRVANLPRRKEEATPPTYRQSINAQQQQTAPTANASPASSPYTPYQQHPPNAPTPTNAWHGYGPAPNTARAPTNAPVASTSRQVLTPSNRAAAASAKTEIPFPPGRLLSQYLNGYWKESRMEGSGQLQCACRVKSADGRRCSFVIGSKTSMRKHLANEHGITVEYLAKAFPKS